MRIVATRLHTTNEDTPIDTEKIDKWCKDVLNYCDLLIVVVDKRYYDTTHNILDSYGNRLKLFFIDPWISFTQPLNLLIEKALSLGAKELLFQSIELTISLNDMLILEKHLKKDTLVVGAKICEKHCPENLDYPTIINGWTTPWNTLALWNLEKLALTGFLSISSGNLTNIAGGIEEVVTISLLQKLQPKTMKAKVIKLPSVVWNIEWSSEERNDYHRKKMKSKDKRSQIQLKHLNIQAGKVSLIV